MNSLRRRIALFILASLGVVLLAGALLAVALFARVGFPLSGRIALVAAQTRWEGRSFDAYTMRLSGYERTSLCPASDYTVRDEQIVQPVNAPPGSCGTYTVTDLFQRVADFEPTCGPNGCACDGALTMDVAYDPMLGYPTRIAIHLDPALKIRYASYWLGAVPLVRRRGCTLIGYGGYEIRVLSLTPIP